MAIKFSFGREVIYRKFLNQKLIPQEQYNTKTKQWITENSKGDGEDYFNSKLTYLGEEYVSLAFQRYYQNINDYNQLSDYPDMKPKNVSRLEELLSKSNS
ncbi:MAG: hypothetical protein OXD45_01425 [Rhodobacteraceae bacterium]|nr:hypothetical protein [Paracoccaceae bacterium]MCY4309211.1 hypothetical protein [Paracoccaceae bacterium]